MIVSLGPQLTMDELAALGWYCAPVTHVKDHWGAEFSDSSLSIEAPQQKALIFRHFVGAASGIYLACYFAGGIIGSMVTSSHGFADLIHRSTRIEPMWREFITLTLRRITN
jgi:hypothetical protein